MLWVALGHCCGTPLRRTQLFVLTANRVLKLVRTNPGICVTGRCRPCPPRNAWSVISVICFDEVFLLSLASTCCPPCFFCLQNLYTKNEKISIVSGGGAEFEKSKKKHTHTHIYTPTQRKHTKTKIEPKIYIIRKKKMDEKGSSFSPQDVGAPLFASL